jgi:hypothetical protein
MALVEFSERELEMVRNAVKSHADSLRDYKHWIQKLPKSKWPDRTYAEQNVDAEHSEFIRLALKLYEAK